MNVLFLDAYFEPEQIAFTHLEHDLLEKLSEEGNHVDVICPTPTRGVTKEKAEEYKSIRTETIYNGHVHVQRFSAPQEGKNPLVRAIRYFWCNYKTYKLGKRKKDCDLVFCNSTPPTQGWIACKVARKLKVPFIYSLQDVFPDSLVTTGLTKKGSLIWKIGRKLEDSIYHGCESIIVITEAMKKNLLKKGVEERKIRVISNWIDIDKVKPIEKKHNHLFDEFALDRDKFTVVYAGNFGEAQGAEIILEAAEELQDYDNIQFVVFGGGSGFVGACYKAKNMRNIFIHPLLPQDRIAEVYSMGDVALITAREGVGKSGMPSKTWSIMACNVPIIAAFDRQSELSQILHKAHAGVCNNPGDVKAMASSILELQACNYTTYGREYVEKHASKQYCVNRYLSVFSE